SDNGTSHQNQLKAAHPHLAGKIAGNGPGPPEGGEGACAAFGYLRGLHERANAVEFRLKNGNSVWFPYHWLGTVKFDPSTGLLLKFSGDLVYLVLVRGSNLDQRLKDGGIDLIRAGLQRHRVMWVREMSEDDVRETGETGPTIDGIEVAEFESHADLKAWMEENAPGFA
ncbi:MAG: hypothetical protein ACRC1K_23145, partial [Planctomycetia bacterium]